MFDLDKFSELDRANPPDFLISEAKRIFGTTSSCDDAGWILPDGSLLPLVRHKLGTTAFHSDVGEAITGGKDISYSATVTTRYFQRRANAIRYAFQRDHHIDISCYNQPTERQWQTIERCLIDKPGIFFYDIVMKDGSVFSGRGMSIPQHFSRLRKTFEKVCQI